MYVYRNEIKFVASRQKNIIKKDRFLIMYASQLIKNKSVGLICTWHASYGYYEP
jgi:hypothetical protein